MKKLWLLLAAFLAVGFSTRDAGGLSKKERKFAANYLKETRDGFLKDVKGLSEAQLNFKTAPEKNNSLAYWNDECQLGK